MYVSEQRSMQQFALFSRSFALHMCFPVSFTGTCPAGVCVCVRECARVCVRLAEVPMCVTLKSVSPHVSRMK